MEYGNIVVVILVVLVAIVQQVMSKRKRDAQGKAGGCSQQPDVLTDTFGEVVYDGAEEDEEREVYEYEASDGYEEVKDVRRGGEAVMSVDEGAEAGEEWRATGEMVAVDAGADDVERAGGDIDLSDVEEARKAFVYSEIFGRKY